MAQPYNKHEIEIFLKFLAGLAKEPSAHLRVEVTDAASGGFVKSIQTSAASWQRLADEVAREEGELHDVHVILATMNKGASDHSACSDRDIDKVLGFVVDVAVESLDVAKNFGKAAIEMTDSDGESGFFLVDPPRKVQELRNLTDGIADLTKRWLGKNRVAFRVRLPGTVCFPRNIGAAPNQPTMTKMRVL